MTDHPSGTRACATLFADGNVRERSIVFASLAAIGAVLLELVGRSWTTTFLTRGRTSFAFSLEEA
jgi:hypothetical protein